MSFITNLLDKICISADKQKKLDETGERFDYAYDAVIKLLPEKTVGDFIKQLPNKEKNGA